jgi:hypothetical protein
MTQKFLIILLILLCTGVCQSFAQQPVSIGTNQPHSSAMLDLSSNSLGLLPPRMSFNERNNISGPATSLIIWCSDCGVRGEMQVFDGMEWKKISASTANLPSPPSTGRPIHHSTEILPQTAKIAD